MTSRRCWVKERRHSEENFSRKKKIQCTKRMKFRTFRVKERRPSEQKTAKKASQCPKRMKFRRFVGFKERRPSAIGLAITNKTHHIFQKKMTSRRCRVKKRRHSEKNFRQKKKSHCTKRIKFRTVRVKERRPSEQKTAKKASQCQKRMKFRRFVGFKERHPSAIGLAITNKTPSHFPKNNGIPTMLG